MIKGSFFNTEIVYCLELATFAIKIKNINTGDFLVACHILLSGKSSSGLFTVICGSTLRIKTRTIRPTSTTDIVKDTTEYFPTDKGTYQKHMEPETAGITGPNSTTISIKDTFYSYPTISWTKNVFYKTESDTNDHHFNFSKSEFPCEYISDE